MEVVELANMHCIIYTQLYSLYSCDYLLLANSQVGSWGIAAHPEANREDGQRSGVVESLFM